MINRMRSIAVAAAIVGALAALLGSFAAAVRPTAARSRVPVAAATPEAAGRTDGRPFDVVAAARAHVAARFKPVGGATMRLVATQQVASQGLAALGLGRPAAAADTLFDVVVFEGPFNVGDAGPGIGFTQARYVVLVYDGAIRRLALTHISVDGARIRPLLTGASR